MSHTLNILRAKMIALISLANDRHSDSKTYSASPGLKTIKAATILGVNPTILECQTCQKNNLVVSAA